MTRPIFARRALAFGTLLCVGACGDGPVDPTGGVSLALDSESVTVSAGGTTMVGLTVTRAGGTSDAVTLLATDLPAGIDVFFDPSELEADESSSVMTINVGSGVAPGAHAFTVRGEVAGGGMATAAVEVAVSALTTLVSGEAEAGLSGSEYSERLYRIAVPEGATSLTVTAAVESGEVTLLVREGQAPDLIDYDCESWFEEPRECGFEDPAAGDWYIMVYGTSAYSGVLLMATVTVPGPPVDFAQLTSSWHHTCGLDLGGQAWCWGSGYQGQLGTGTGDMRDVPTPVNTSLAFMTITVGNAHTCAIATDGQAYCWGDNYGGKLGDGTTTQRMLPVEVGGGLEFTEIVAGDNHTCGLTASGVMYCWGFNVYGVIGDSTLQDRHTPTPVSGDHTFEKIFVGGAISCATESGGAAYCWGADTWGELGTGNSPSDRVPAPVVGDLAFAALAPAGGHNCGITTDGAAYCWGMNAYGQLGDGTQTYRTTGPHPVSSTLAFSRIDTGSDHTCAIASDGTAHCWGVQIAGGTASTGSYQLSPRPVSGTTLFTEVTAGQQYSCAMSDAGRAYCWGAGGNGKLGNGDANGSVVYEPIEVSRPN